MMFFMIIGVGVFAYGCFYALTTALFDCDVLLGFMTKFGKRPHQMKGKVVFITGASSGIGEHTAYAFAKAGVKLVLAARRNMELQKVKQQCVALSQGQLDDKDVLVIPMDLLDISAHKMHFQHAVKHFGKVDVLLNNAGNDIGNLKGRSQNKVAWESIDLSVDKQLFDLNVFSAVNLTRVALEYFNKRGEGHVAVVSSLAGIIGVPLSGAYSGSKHALHGYFNSLRTEKYGKNIYVTILCPGPVFTTVPKGAFNEKDGQRLNRDTQASNKRMTAERCGYLNAVAITNKVSEAWIALFPVVSLTYISVYFPLLAKALLALVGPQKLFQIKESKESNRTEVRVV